MKQLLIICLSLSLLLGGLRPNNHLTANQIKPAVLSPLHLFKQTRKGLLRYNANDNLIYTAIGNSMHFILSALPAKTWPF